MMVTRLSQAKLTDLGRPITKPEPGEHHLAQTKSGTKAGEPADSQDTQQVEEEADEDGIDKAESEGGVSKHADSERTAHHVGRQPLRRVSLGGRS